MDGFECGACDGRGWITTEQALAGWVDAQWLAKLHRLEGRGVPPEVAALIVDDKRQQLLDEAAMDDALEGAA